MPENALRNMEAIGYVSAIGGHEILAAAATALWEAQDVSYFFGPSAVAACVNPVQYPAARIISRCGVLHDTGDRTEDLLAMWTRVKGDNASTFTFVLLGIAIVALLAGFFASKNCKNSRRRSKR